MIVAILSGFVLALLAPWMHSRAPRVAGPLLALLPAGLTAYFLAYGVAVANGDIIGATVSWVPTLGVDFAFRIDGLGLVFALLITGIGALVVLYASSYMAGDSQLGRFYMYILIFMASMLGVVLANDIFTLFVFWELTSISSYLLIGFKHDKPTSRAAALQALLVTGGGGLAMLGGLVLLGQVAGTTIISELPAQAAAIRDHALYLPILLLVLAGAFTKSAQAPFHFWLPGAMEAPTPVSAYLHSATMVKAGVYLLARLSSVLANTDEWTILVTAVGGATMLLGAFLAWQQVDLKRILAYSTISALGMLVMLLGIGTSYAAKAAMTLLVAHSLYKGSLFLVAGILDHETGTRDVTQMGGLARAMPYTAAAAVLAAASMVGLPPLFGFISKEVFYQAAYDAPAAPGLLTGLAVVSSMMIFAAGALVSVRPFFGPLGDTPRKPHEAPLRMVIGPLLLAVLGVLIALRLTPLVDYAVRPATEALLNAETDVELVLWPGINIILGLSLFTVAAGVLVYLGRAPLRRWLGGLDTGSRFGPALGYRHTINGLLWLANWQTRILQNGYLRFYLITIVSTTVLLVGYTLIFETDLGGSLRTPHVRVYEAVLAVVIIAAAVTVTQTRSRLAAVVALGTVGYGIALIYILFGAPDLAMTQFAIETLTVVLFVLVIYRLPRFSSFSSTSAKLRDAVISLSVGALMTLLVLVVTSLESSARLTSYFAQNSVLMAKGRNIVNVILVDFRGLDTLGEIVVLAVAAAGVYSLMKLRPVHEPGTKVKTRRIVQTEEVEAREPVAEIEAGDAAFR